VLISSQRFFQGFIDSPYGAPGCVDISGANANRASGFITIFSTTPESADRLFDPEDLIASLLLNLLGSILKEALERSQEMLSPRALLFIQEQPPLQPQAQAPKGEQLSARLRGLMRGPQGMHPETLQPSRGVGITPRPEGAKGVEARRRGASQGVLYAPLLLCSPSDARSISSGPR